MNKCESCQHKEVCKYREECEKATIVVPIEFLEYNCKYFQPEVTVYYRDNCAKPISINYHDNCAEPLCGGFKL